MEYQVVLTAQARQQVIEIKDRREQTLILERLEKLKSDPEIQGKALSGELAGYRSLRAAGQRYRVIYRVERNKILVVVVGVGRRKEGDKRDIYVITQQSLLDWIDDQALSEAEDAPDE